MYAQPCPVVQDEDREPTLVVTNPAQPSDDALALPRPLRCRDSTACSLHLFATPGGVSDV